MSDSHLLPLDKEALELPEGETRIPPETFRSASFQLEKFDAEVFFSLSLFFPPPVGLTVLQACWGNVSHRGVFTDKGSVPKGTRFGPFQGKLVNTSEIKTYDDNTLMWEVAASESLHVKSRKNVSINYD